MFKPEDRVVCVENILAERIFRVGDLYTVLAGRKDGFVQIREAPDTWKWWAANRFKKVEFEVDEELLWE